VRAKSDLAVPERGDRNESCELNLSAESTFASDSRHANDEPSVSRKLFVRTTAGRVWPMSDESVDSPLGPWTAYSGYSLLTDLTITFDPLMAYKETEMNDMN
jgi:hypothetical protein